MSSPGTNKASWTSVSQLWSRAKEGGIAFVPYRRKQKCHLFETVSLTDLVGLARHGALDVMIPGEASKAR